jgi:hypothetical protein
VRSTQEVVVVVVRTPGIRTLSRSYGSLAFSPLE